MGMFDNFPSFGNISNGQSGSSIPSMASGMWPDWLNFGNNNGQTPAPIPETAKSGLGFNVGTGQLLLGGLGTLGSLWTAWNATDLAKKQFDFQKKMSTANYMNQMQTYNTNLEDKIRARYAMENKAPDQASAYITSHQLRPAI